MQKRKSRGCNRGRVDRLAFHSWIATMLQCSTYSETRGCASVEAVLWHNRKIFGQVNKAVGGQNPSV